IESIAWSPDSRCVASSAGDGTVRVWEAFTGNTLLTYHSLDPSPYMRAAVWSPDGRSIASSCLEGKVQVWEATSARRLATLPGDFTPLSGLPDGPRLAMIQNDQAEVGDVASARLVLTHQSQPVFRGAIAWSPDGARIATAFGEDVGQYEKQPIVTSVLDNY